MPIIQSKYKAPFLFQNGHWSSIYPSVFRKIQGVETVRERISTPDKDFLDLDWSKKGYKKLVLVLHGLEGDAGRPYVQGMIKLFNQNGYDGVGMNFRGCSGEINRSLQMYHSGDIRDVSFALDYIGTNYDYREVVLIGFSLGGSITLNYVGRKGTKINPLLKKAIAVSTPVDLVKSATKLDEGKFNKLVYVRRFLKKLYEKVELKEAQYPGTFDLKKIKKYTTFYGFDDAVTAKVNGFTSALDYYTKASSLPFLQNTAIPTYILSAKNDSFLSETSYPFAVAESNPNIYLEVPEKGGHVGFPQFGKNGVYYAEERALDFVLGKF
ncbi:MAG: YheT family hydrolase [Saprospiraceae bacterium]